MSFKILGELSGVETIAVGRAIRELRSLRKCYGGRRWRKLKAAKIELPSATICLAEPHCYEAHDCAEGTQDQTHLGRIMKRGERNFVVCVSNRGYPASLEVRKLYQSIQDQNASRIHQLRVIDESGEDYLYPEEYFVPVQLPQSAGRAVLSAR